MKKNYYAKALALTVAASMASVPAFAAEGTDDPQAQEGTVEQDEQKGEKSAKEEQEKTEQSVKEEKIELLMMTKKLPLQKGKFLQKGTTAVQPKKMRFRGNW